MEPLYPQLLGDSWSRLSDAVRGLHCGGSAVRCTGVMRVSRGASLLTRCLASLLGFPAAGEAVPVTLAVVPSAGAEQWRRTFAGVPLVTLQSAGPDGLLVERTGLAELRFRLEVRDGGLVYHAAGAALKVGWLRVPLPSWLAPTVAARESPVGPPGQTEVSVRMSVPLLGLLISYEGSMTRSEEAA
jgi:hypothetical protein